MTCNIFQQEKLTTDFCKNLETRTVHTLLALKGIIMVYLNVYKLINSFHMLNKNCELDISYYVVVMNG